MEWIKELHKLNFAARFKEAERLSQWKSRGGGGGPGRAGVRASVRPDRTAARCVCGHRNQERL